MVRQLKFLFLIARRFGYVQDLKLALQQSNLKYPLEFAQLTMIFAKEDVDCAWGLSRS